MQGTFAVSECTDAWYKKNWATIVTLAIRDFQFIEKQLSRDTQQHPSAYHPLRELVHVCLQQLHGKEVLFCEPPFVAAPECAFAQAHALRTLLKGARNAIDGEIDLGRFGGLGYAPRKCPRVILGGGWLRGGDTKPKLALLQQQRDAAAIKRCHLSETLVGFPFSRYNLVPFFSVPERQEVIVVFRCGSTTVELNAILEVYAAILRVENDMHAPDVTAEKATSWIEQIDDMLDSVDHTKAAIRAAQGLGEPVVYEERA